MVMRRLGIIDVADNDINEVSGGQFQRACICRSMIDDPKMIFADEPTGALNRASSDEVMEELAKLNSEGTTIMRQDFCYNLLTKARIKDIFRIKLADTNTKVAAFIKNAG